MRQNNDTVSATEVIQTFLSRGRRQALASGTPLPQHETGLCLFADISGFTPLTESLTKSLEPQQGAESLTEVINGVMEALITQVHLYGGDVMGFAGDSILCWFPENPSEQVLSCALAMQAEMPQFAAVPTPDGATHTLTMKIGLAQGPVRRLLVGAPEHGYFELLTGATLTRVADAEHHAKKGEIVCAPEIVSAVGDAATWGEYREGFQPLLTLSKAAVASPIPGDRLLDLSPELLRPYFPPALFEWLSGTQSRLLAELRPVVSAFIRFEGLDFEADAQAEEELDQYVRAVQRLATRYGGSMVRLDYGDKGSVAHVIFGAPVTHEDDEARAVGWVLALQEAIKDLPFITGQYIGMTKGHVYAGALGATTRRGYTLMGDEVNASARLMQACQRGQVLVSERIMRATQKQFMFHQFPGFMVKGKFEPIPVATPVAPLPPMQHMQPTGPLIGREAEMAQTDEALDAILDGAGRVLRIEGQAGVGKSRLVAELLQNAAARGVRTLVGRAQNVGQDTAFLPWRDLFQVLFGLQSGWPAPQQAMQIENMVRWMNPAWLVRVPLFGDLLGIDIPDNPTTSAFDVRLRQQSLFALVGDLLALMAKQQPLLILIEDCHWIDEASAALIESLGFSLASARVLLVITQRPPDDPDHRILPGLDTLKHYTRLDLDELTPEAVRVMVTDRLGGELPPDILKMIQERAQGNPFFVEELAETLRETAHLELEEGQWVLASGVGSLPELPDTIQGVVLARLDRLEEDIKFTIKVASVVGRVFEVEVVQHIHPDRILSEILRAQLDELERRDMIIEEVPPPNQVEQFKHHTTQEVAYATLLYSQRRALHQAVAEWYEKALGFGEISSLSPYYALLAHHFHHAEIGDRERHYARLAGEQAARQCANDEAVTYLSRAIELTPETDTLEHYSLLLTREKVYDVQGAREAQSQDLASLKELAKTLDDDGKRAEVALRQSGHKEATGDYRATIDAAQQAITWAQAAQETVKEATGSLLWGRALMRQGEYESAQAQLESTLAYTREAQDSGEASEVLRGLEADSLYNLGIVLRYRGDYSTAKASYEQAMHTYQEIGNRTGEARSLNGLGSICVQEAKHKAAMTSFESALRICREIGERRGEGVLLANLGVILERQGDYVGAGDYFEQALRLTRQIGDRLGEARTLNNLGTISLYQGNYVKGRDYLESSLQIGQEIGHRQHEGQVLSNLGLLFHHLGDNQTARDYSLQALQTAQEMGERRTEAVALTHLGHALAGLEQWTKADDAYKQALAIRRELGEDPLAIESLAGLARVSLARGDSALARTQVEEILDYLEGNSLHGTEEPFRIHLTSYQVLQATNETARARELLTTAYDLLQEQAARIGSEEMRTSFLDRVAAHREIIQECAVQKAQTMPPTIMPEVTMVKEPTAEPPSTTEAVLPEVEGSVLPEGEPITPEAEPPEEPHVVQIITKRKIKGRGKSRKAGKKKRKKRKRKRTEEEQQGVQIVILGEPTHDFELTVIVKCRIEKSADEE